MTRDEAIRAYAGPRDASEVAWDKWTSHLARLYRSGSVTFEQCVWEWDPPTELQANEGRMAGLADVRRGRQRLRAKGRRLESRREARLGERVERMRNRGRSEQ